MCPNCKKALIVLDLNDIEVDYCTHCGGIWLDEGELELIFDFAEADGEPLLDEIFQAKTGRKTKKPCVRCGAKMQEVQAGRPSVAIDRCPLGDGIWFDQGELLALIQNRQGNTKNPAADFLADLYAAQIEGESKGEL